MTTTSWTGRALAALHDLPSLFSARTPADAPPGWDRPAHDPAADGDPLAWLGFEVTGERDRPLLQWPRPQRWPDDAPADLAGTRAVQA